MSSIPEKSFFIDHSSANESAPKHSRPEIPGEKQARLLVIDDDPDCLEAFTDTLEMQGFKVAGFTSPKLAIRSFEPDEFDLVVSDMKMPGMTGVEVLEEVKKAEPALPVILVTGFTEDNEPGRALEMGAAAFFHKPLQLELFLDTVHRLGIGGSETDVLQ